jgi:hypothetical protein
VSEPKFTRVTAVSLSFAVGMVADMFDAEEQQYAVLWASFW